MATQLRNIVRFTGVAPSTPTSLAHNLNLDGVGLVPDLLIQSRGDYTVTADDTNVTVTNNGLIASSIDVFVVHWHTIDRVFGADTVTSLTPQPFVVVGDSAGSATGNEQIFRFTAAGGEGSDFTVTLPSARPNDNYVIMASLADAASIFGMRFPDTLAGDRTTTTFRVLTTAALTAGDVIEFRVIDA